MADTSAPRDTMIVGATVRTLGAWPSGWRYPGAHRHPAHDPDALRSIATTAERAGLHFLYFGDWLATGADFELTDPYLLARIEPLAAIGYLAAITEHVGLIATVNSAHAEAYSTARAAASIDLLSGGRVGISVSHGSERRSAANFGWDTVHLEEDRIAASDEFIDILRGLWDSWDDDAFVADAATGRLIDRSRLHQLDFVGHRRASAGPLNVVRPPQGHPVVAIAGGAQNARALAASQADLSFISPGSLREGVEQYTEAKRAARELGRDPHDFVLISPILPIVSETREAAWRLYDELVELVQVETAAGVDGGHELPANRTIRRLAGVLGVSLNGVLIDEAVPPRIAARFSPLGAELLTLVGLRSGRTVGGYRPVTYRHLLVAHAVAAPVLVGSGSDIADHMQTWFESGATDGFTVLSAFGAQFDDFADLVIPELRRRGLFSAEPEGGALRDRLGLPRPANLFAAALAR